MNLFASREGAMLKNIKFFYRIPYNFAGFCTKNTKVLLLTLFSLFLSNFYLVSIMTYHIIAVQLALRLFGKFQLNFCWLFLFFL